MCRRTPVDINRLSNKETRNEICILVLKLVAVTRCADEEIMENADELGLTNRLIMKHIKKAYRLKNHILEPILEETFPAEECVVNMFVCF